MLSHKIWLPIVLLTEIMLPTVILAMDCATAISPVPDREHATMLTAHNDILQHYIGRINKLGEIFKQNATFTGGRKLDRKVRTIDQLCASGHNELNLIYWQALNDVQSDAGTAVAICQRTIGRMSAVRDNYYVEMINARDEDFRCATFGKLLKTPNFDARHALGARIYAITHHFKHWLDKQKPLHINELTAPAQRKYLEDWYSKQSTNYYLERSNLLESLKQLADDITIDNCNVIYRKCRDAAVSINRKMYNYVFSTGIAIPPLYIRSFQGISDKDIQRDRIQIKTSLEENMQNEQTRANAKLIVSNLIGILAGNILVHLNQQRVNAQAALYQKYMANCYPSYTCGYLQRTNCYRIYILTENLSVSLNIMRTTVSSFGQTIGRTIRLDPVQMGQGVYKDVLINLLNGRYNDIRHQIEKWARDYVTNIINCDFEMFHNLLR